MHSDNKLDRQNAWQDQGGFTLVELIIVTAVVGFLASVMAFMFSVVTRVSSVSTSQNIVLSQVQQAGSWMTRDIVSSDNVTVYTSGNRLVSMDRYRWDGVTSTIQTARVDYDVESGQLLRKLDGGQGLRVAQFIAGPNTDTRVTASTAPSECNTYIFNVTATYGNSSFSRVYKMSQRVQ